MEDIGTAIMHGAAAGKLRAYVRKNGEGLAGLIRLADRHTAAATAALGKVRDAQAGEKAHASLQARGERACGEG